MAFTSPVYAVTIPAQKLLTFPCKDLLILSSLVYTSQIIFGFYSSLKGSSWEGIADYPDLLLRFLDHWQGLGLPVRDVS
jgi:hypothetical protein